MAGRAAPEDPENSDKSLTTPRFSEQDNVRYGTERRYRRMSKDRFEDEAEVAAGAGSLWVMEGQGAYLFAQNRTRLVGDLLNVRLDGAPRTQLQMKTRVIAKLLERLERPERSESVRAPTGVAAQPGAPAQPPAPQPNQAPAAAAPGQGEQAGQQPPGAVAQAPTPPSPRPETSFSVERVPTRIVEVLKDGSYRIKGSQEFMIGKREYRVIVTGIIRPEDFDEGGIEAEKLLDPQFDIVSNKRGATL